MNHGLTTTTDNILLPEPKHILQRFVYNLVNSYVAFFGDLTSYLIDEHVSVSEGNVTKKSKVHPTLSPVTTPFT